MKKIILFFCFILFTHAAIAQEHVDEGLAYQFYERGEYDKAAILLEKLFNQRKEDNFFELYFNALIKIKKYQEAETFIRKLLRTDPTKTLYQISLGRIFLENGKNDEANKIFTQTIANVKKDEFSIRELANQFSRFEAYDLMTSTFLNGRKILADDNAFIFELISIYRFRKNKIPLIEEYMNALIATPQVLPQAQSAFSIVFEGKSDFQLLQTALLRKLQKNPDLEALNQLLIWQFLQQEEYEMALRQLIALDKRTKDNGAFLFQTANTFVTNKAYPTAIKAYEYLLAKGRENDFYLASKIQMVNAKFELAITGKYDPKEIETLADQYMAIVNDYGKTAKTIFALQRWAYLQAYYLNKLTKAESALEECLKIPDISSLDIARLKLELGDTYILTQQPWEATLMYEQVAKQYETNPIGHDAKFRATKLSFYQGDFKYAKAQADVLKSGTSQLIANDALNLSLLISDNVSQKTDSLALLMYAQAELTQFKNKQELALAQLDSINLVYPKSNLEDDILMSKAKIFEKTNRYNDATLLLKELISSFPTSIWADDALYLLGETLEIKLNNKEQAKKYYQQLMTDFPSSIYNAEARKRYRNLRGDNIGT